MSFDANAITAILTGLAGLIAALGAFAANRTRRIAQDQKILRRRVRELERQILALVEHTFVLELELARAGRKVPDRPLILEQLSADDDEEDADRGSPPTTSGRHALRED